MTRREALSLGQQLAVLRSWQPHAARYAQGDFDRPAHRFVASFVGELGMNLVEVDVVRDETNLQISTPGGGNSISFPAADALGNATLPITRAPAAGTGSPARKGHRLDRNAG